jgi:hypothetical protein
MDMTFEEYTDFLNSLMMQVFLNNCGAADAGPDVYGFDDHPYDEDDGILIDEA